MSNRRNFLRAVGAGAAVAPMFANAQVQAGRPYRIGIIALGETSLLPPSLISSFVASMRDLGYVEGRNVVYELRSARGDIDRLAGLAAELVQLPVDVISVGNTASTLAAKNATSTIPIVMTGTNDPVGNGLVASLARPGGNITGLSGNAGVEIVGKMLQILKDSVPGMSKVGLLIGPAQGRSGEDLKSLALKLGLSVVPCDEIRRLEDIESAFSFFVKQRVDGFCDLGGAVTYSRRQQIADLALAHRLPGIGGMREFPLAGLLLSYGANFGDILRRSAIYVDKILKGASPSNLPIEQPILFDWVINMRTARSLGVAVPQAIRLSATEVID